MEQSDKLWTPSFVIGAVVNFLIMANYYIPMVVVTNYSMNAYGASESLAGMVASIFIVGALVSRLVAGTFIAVMGARRLLVVSVIAEVAFSALYFLDAGLYPLMVLRFVHGFWYGTASSSVGTAVTSIIPDSHKGEGVGYFMLSNTLGTAVGPFFGIALSQSLGIHGVFAGCLAAAAICLVSLLGFRPGKAAAKPSSSAPRAHGVKALLEPTTVPIGIAACLVFFSYSAVLTFLTPFAEETNLTGAASFFFVAYAIAMFVSRLFTGKLFDRHGAVAVMVPSFFCAAAGFALIGTAPNGVMLIIGAAVLGFGIGTIQSCGLTMAVQATTIDRLSFANSTYYAFTDLGVGIGPLVLGAIIPMVGYRGLFLSMIVVIAVAFLWYLVVEKRHRARLAAKNG